MRVVLVVLVGVSGCFILPAERTDTRVVESTLERPRPGPTGAVELRADIVGRTVLVTAQRVRTCTAEEIGVVETHREKHVTIEGIDPGHVDGAWWLVAMLGAVMVATGTVSGLVTGVILLVDGDGTTTRERKRLRRVESACPVPEPDVAIDVTFAAGQVAHDRTNAGGVITVPIPDDAGGGFIVARAAALEASAWYGAGPPETTPSREPPRAATETRGFAGVRDVLRACAAPLHIVGLVHARLEIDREGRVGAELDRDEPGLAACVRDGLAAVRFPPDHPKELVFPYQL